MTTPCEEKQKMEVDKQKLIRSLTSPISKRMSLKALTVVGDVLKGIPAEKLAEMSFDERSQLDRYITGINLVYGNVKPWHLSDGFVLGYFEDVANRTAEIRKEYRPAKIANLISMALEHRLGVRSLPVSKDKYRSSVDSGLPSQNTNSLELDLDYFGAVEQFEQLPADEEEYFRESKMDYVIKLIEETAA